MNADALKVVCLAFPELNVAQWYQIAQLRAEVFIVEQNCVYQDLDGRDQESLHLCIFEKGQLVAYCRLLPPGLAYENYASIGRVVTATAVRKSGMGRRLMKEALAALESRFHAVPIKISAQSYLLKFYESFGFEPFGDDYLEDGIPHRAMIKR